MEGQSKREGEGYTPHCEFRFKDGFCAITSRYRPTPESCVSSLGAGEAGGCNFAVSGFGGVGVESFCTLRLREAGWAAAAAAAALPPRAAPMLPHTGGLLVVSVDVLRTDGTLPAVGPRERLAGRFGESPGSGDRSRVPNLAFAVD